MVAGNIAEPQSKTGSGWKWARMRDCKKRRGKKGIKEVGGMKDTVEDQEKI